MLRQYTHLTRMNKLGRGQAAKHEPRNLDPERAPADITNTELNRKLKSQQQCASNSLRCVDDASGGALGIRIARSCIAACPLPNLFILVRCVYCRLRTCSSRLKPVGILLFDIAKPDLLSQGFASLTRVRENESASKVEYSWKT
jgi:hypothetical protein